MYIHITCTYMCILLQPLDKQQCWQWVLDHRLPLFLRSDLFSEYKLCKRLTAPQIIDDVRGKYNRRKRVNDDGLDAYNICEDSIVAQ